MNYQRKTFTTTFRGSLRTTNSLELLANLEYELLKRDRRPGKRAILLGMIIRFSLSSKSEFNLITNEFDEYSGEHKILLAPNKIEELIAWSVELGIDTDFLFQKIVNDFAERRVALIPKLLKYFRYYDQVILSGHESVKDGKKMVHETILCVASLVGNKTLTSIRNFYLSFRNAPSLNFNLTSYEYERPKNISEFQEQVLRKHPELVHETLLFLMERLPEDGRKDISLLFSWIFEERGLSDEVTVEKIIEFDEIHYDAGVNILSYFSSVLPQKHPQIGAKVVIEQDGLTVRLKIMTQEGLVETIEATLQNYGEIITGMKEPEDLFENQLFIARLKARLDAAVLELRNTERIFQIEKSYFLKESERTQKENDRLHDDISWLRGLIAKSITSTGDLGERQIEIIERLSSQLAATTDRVATSYGIIISFLASNDQEVDKEKVVSALVNIKRENPKIFGELSDFIKDIKSSVVGNMLFQIISNFP